MRKPETIIKIFDFPVKLNYLNITEELNMARGKKTIFLSCKNGVGTTIIHMKRYKNNRSHIINNLFWTN